MADGSRSMHPTIVVYKVTLGDRRIQNVKAVVNAAAPAVAGVVARYPVQAPADLTAVADTLKAIESMPEDTIRSVATRLSPDFIGSARAVTIADGLLRRRIGLRDALRREYGGGL